ncbi:MAG: hypothetical protein IJQ80_00300, partial [Clostridia bacterium]|nr:hypothetical protein [Clostridia bacterium]
MKLIAKVVKYAVLVSLAVSLISLSESVKNGCRGAINAAGDAADAVIAAFDEVTDITVREYDNKIGLFRDGE